MSKPVAQYAKGVVVKSTHQNTDQEVVVITIDKLRLVIHEHRSCLQDSKEWQAPAGILLSLITTFFTADFKLFLNVSADTWRAVYMIATGLIILWLLRSLGSLRNRKSIEDLFHHIKNPKTN